MGGTTYQQAAGTWLAGSGYTTANQFNFLGTLNNVFELFDVSLTEGSVAPPFQLPDYPTELALCKRYYYKRLFGTNEFIAMLQAYSTSSANGNILVHSVEMRGPPTPLYSAGSHFSLQTAGGGAIAGLNTFTITANATGAGAAVAGSAATLVAGNGTSLFSNNAATWLSFNARL